MAEIPRRQQVIYGSMLPPTPERHAGIGRRQHVISNPMWLDPYPSGSRGATKRAYESEVLRQQIREQELEQIKNEDLIKSIVSGKPVGVWAPKVNKVQVSDKLKAVNPETVAMMGLAATPQVMDMISGVPKEKRYQPASMPELKDVARARGLTKESPAAVALAKEQAKIVAGGKVPENIKESRQIFLGLAKAYGASENDEVMAAIGTMAENPTSRAIIQKFFGSKTMDPQTKSIYEQHMKRLNDYYGGGQKGALEISPDLTTTDVTKLQDTYNKLRKTGISPEEAEKMARQELGLLGG